jgi:hypothetical protein
LLRIGGARRKASHGRVIGILLIWGKRTGRLTAALVLRVSVIVWCHAHPIAHALIRIRAILSNLSGAHPDAHPGLVPLEARLSPVGKETAGSAETSCILSPIIRTTCGDIGGVHCSGASFDTHSC